MSGIIISNQIKCNKCLDVIFSAHVHNCVSCGCGAVSVDGGTQYLKRSFTRGTDYTEMSISISQEQKDELLRQANWCKETGRNSFGYVCAILRACRDTGLLNIKEE